jgi:DNA repair protein RadA/Sms
VEEPAAGSGARTAAPSAAPVRLGEVPTGGEARIPTGVAELDRVLGGGIVPGSLVLIGGEPGIGKSTLVMQALAHLSRSRRVLLVTGEESPAQVRTRAARLASPSDDVEVVAETRLQSVVALIESGEWGVCAIDSVQTLGSDAFDGAPGTVGQIREAAAELLRVAKSTGVAILLVGQVTKDGALAGPRLLEHLVDCVVAFDADDGRAHRVLRATKNRFGSTNELGILEMRHDGLVSLDDPTAVWLTEAGERVGSCVFPALEGSRALLVEIQALVAHTEVVPPRRVAVGVDRTRLAQVIAILTRHAGLRLGDRDVFVSVAGGARALEPAADLAIALALASAHRDRPLGAGTVAFGELGLTGGVRPVAAADRRLAAASEKGLKCGIIPGGEREGRGATRDGVVRVGAIGAALDAAF